jgi:hypothetical protein
MADLSSTSAPKGSSIPMKSLLMVGILSLLFGFSCGLFTGRLFPAHHFERFGESRYLLDSATGRVCDPLPKPNVDPALTAVPPPGFAIQSPSATIGPCAK